MKPEFQDLDFDVNQGKWNEGQVVGSKSRQMNKLSRKKSRDGMNYQGKEVYKYREVIKEI